MDSQFLRNLIFIPLTKVTSAHRSINYFQILWCHMIDETFSHPLIWKLPQNISYFSFGRLFKSVNFFWDTLYSVWYLNVDGVQLHCIIVPTVLNLKEYHRNFKNNFIHYEGEVKFRYDFFLFQSIISNCIWFPVSCDVDLASGQFHGNGITNQRFWALSNHFVLYSYDLRQFEYFYKVQRYPCHHHLKHKICQSSLL